MLLQCAYSRLLSSAAYVKRFVGKKNEKKKKVVNKAVASEA